MLVSLNKIPSSRQKSGNVGENGFKCSQLKEERDAM